MADDLRLQLVVQAILDAKGFDEAKASIAGLASTTNRSADSLKEWNDALKGSAEGQEVSSREIKILTREMLQSVGASEGAGSAGRLAAVAFSALGNSAMLANLALTGIGFTLAFLLPRIIEWIGSTDDNSKAQAELRDRLIEVGNEVRGLTESIPGLDESLKKWTNTLHDLSLDKETEKWRDLKAQMVAIEDQMNREGDASGQLLSKWKALEAASEIINNALKQDKTVTEAATDAKRAYAREVKDIEDYEKQHAAALLKSMDFQADLDRFEANARQEDLDDRLRASDFAKKQVKDAQRDMAADVLFTKKELTEKRKAQDEYNKQLKRDYDQEAQWANDDIVAQHANTDSIIANYAAAGSSLAEAFGKNKALNIASAIANTWAGADLALATYAYNPPLAIAMAAAIAAAGLANVVNIEKASPGFDDPMNDIIAEKLGRKSARDFVRLWGGGFHDGLTMATGGGESSSTTVNRNTYFQGGVHLGGFFGGNENELLTQMSRKLNVIARKEGRATL